MIPSSMRVIEIREPGGPEVLQIGERPIPQISENQVLVKTIAAGVNGPDRMQRQGLYPPPPGASDLLGLEVSGEVVSVGEKVARWKPGDLLCALTHGGAYAEYVAIEADHCLPVPANVSAIDAGGLPETFFTVWSNLFLDHQPKEGGLLLVHGGAGGIGATAIQLGKALGMRVFATCSGNQKIEFCERMGAERAINYHEEDFVEIVREEGGADLIVDIIGGDYLPRNIKACALDGRIVQLAFNHGSKVEVDWMPLMLKRLTFQGSTLRARPQQFKARIAADLEKRVWPMFSDGQLTTFTHAVFGFDDVTKAHALMEEKGHVGKIILVP